jgi:hypothetical protein
MKEILVGVHIPKTAGSTFKAILEKVYGDRYLWIPNVHCALYAWTEHIANKDLYNIDFIYGHVPYGLHEFFPEDIKCNYMTFLRNPIERLMSIHNFQIINDFNEDKNNITTNRFLQWLGTFKIAGIENGMTRILNGKIESLLDIPKSLVTENDYLFAQQNLRNMYFVGTAEHFKNDLKFLAKKLNWECIPEQEKIYYFPDRLKRKSLSKLDRKKLEGSQLFDFLLWKEALKMSISREKEFVDE